LNQQRIKDKLKRKAIARRQGNMLRKNEENQAATNAARAARRMRKEEIRSRKAAMRRLREAESDAISGEDGNRILTCHVLGCGKIF